MRDDQSTQPARLFAGCFEFFNKDTEELGTFQIAVHAQTSAEAVQRFRARLSEIAGSSDNMGPIVVDLLGLVELGREGLGKGALFNVVSVDDEGVWSHKPMPEQGLHDSSAHVVDDAPEPGTPRAPDRDRAPAARPFWSGVEDFRNRWKLYWCESDDHSTDKFVVAREDYKASEFHEQTEEYFKDDASAKLVCVLPASEQWRYKRPTWPEDETLLACGAEFLPGVREEGADQLRATAGSGSRRVVRLKGKIFGAGTS